MIYVQSPLAILIFILFVVFVLGLSFYFGKKTKGAEGFFAAGGKIHWGVNGIAFAGDYLSAASFLGICGMIAVVGYDGFLYSIGYLAGWIVALFVVAEAFKRLGRFTFSDALDVKFNSRGIRIMAAISTLVVSLFYLIPQMVGAGVLVTPLLGLPHAAGVIIVGSIVIFIVATAGMASTTYVQFLKGALLIIFSTILVGMLCYRGLSTHPASLVGKDYHQFIQLYGTLNSQNQIKLRNKDYRFDSNWSKTVYGQAGFIKLEQIASGIESIWKVRKDTNSNKVVLEETEYTTKKADGEMLFNGRAANEGAFYPVGHIKTLRKNGVSIKKTGPLNPFSFLARLRESDIVLWEKTKIKDGENQVTIYSQKVTTGARILRPGLKFKVDNATPIEKLNFVSLMLALFCGTAALPHILIRYYTVPDPASARKSTIVAIVAIGFFYILTLFMGLGAMVSGVINISDNNMSGPLLAQSFSMLLFAIISAIAFATVLGTVSGLIVAATGAVAHDVMDVLLKIKMDEKQKVFAGKITAVVVGIIAMYFGIVFKGMNVSFLVGWAFAVAASANLPAIIMLLFWKKTTKEGISASILVGIVSAIGLILLSPNMYVKYGLLASQAPVALNNPGIISIPLSFITLVVVSLFFQSKNKTTSL